MAVVVLILGLALGFALGWRARDRRHRAWWLRRELGKRRLLWLLGVER